MHTSSGLNLSGIHPVFSSILDTHFSQLVCPVCKHNPCTCEPFDELDAEEAADEAPAADPMDGPLGYDSDADAEERAAMEAERRAEEREDW